MGGEQGNLAFTVSRVDHQDGGATLVYQGELMFDQASPFVDTSRELLRRGAKWFAFDLSEVSRIDTATLALLTQLLCELQGRAPAEITGAQGRAKEMLDLYGEPRQCLRPPPKHVGLLEQIGKGTLALIGLGRDILDYLGEVVLAGVASLRQPRTIHWSDVSRLMERAGADGFPIVFLISGLIGMILAFQSAVQLKQFGADIYVANAVGLSITRELGPLMTAIIVAGRSGASFAAELGTMKVSEEIDALRTLGLCPYRFLVYPRLVALVLVLPLLTLMSDLVGLTGGLVTSVGVLDLTPSAYLHQTQQGVDLWDVFSGVLKSFFFAAAIALIACERGLATRGGAEGVGRSTTSAVVTCLFFLVLIDSGFTIMFHAFGV